MNTVTATVAVVPWEHGWELHITSNIGDGVTQVETLDEADAQIRDYLETISDRPIGAVTIRRRYLVRWSAEDEAWVGTVDGVPSLSWIADSRAEALAGIRTLHVTDIAQRVAKRWRSALDLLGNDWDDQR